MSGIYVMEPPSEGKVVLSTTVGDIEIELWPKQAPLGQCLILVLIIVYVCPDDCGLSFSMQLTLLPFWPQPVGISSSCAWR